mgnify:CR=1 FL=1
MMGNDFIENRTFDEIKIGDPASLVRTLSLSDMQLFGLATGDADPDGPDAVANGMWGGGLIAAVLGTQLPGAGATYRSQSLQFVLPVRLSKRRKPSGAMYDRHYPTSAYRPAIDTGNSSRGRRARRRCRRPLPIPRARMPSPQLSRRRKPD